MKVEQVTTWQKCLAVVAVLLLAQGWVNTARAQYDFRWLSVGDFQHRYNGGLGQPEIYEPFPMMVWPGIYNMSPGGVSYMHVMGYWISVKDFTDENGNKYPYRNSHSGPRSKGIGEFFQTEMKLISQFEAPDLRVDDNPTYQVPVTIDAIDPSLKPDRMLLNKVNTSVGISVEQRSFQYSNEYHDDYHITEFRFVNTGNVDGDEEVELPDQNLEDVYFSFIRRPKTSASSTSWDNSAGDAAWGAINQTDIVGNGKNDYGLPDEGIRGEFTWLEAASAKKEYSTIGGPMWVPGSWWYTIQTDTTGRLGAAGMQGEFILHADGAPHPPDPEGIGGFSQPDDPAQPRVMTYMNSDDADLTGNSNHNNIPLMEKERDWIENGVKTRPTALPDVWSNAPVRTVPAQPFVTYPLEGDGPVDFVKHFATTADPQFTGSWSYGNNFGPYDMAPGEEVRIVVFDGVGGLSDTLANELGQWYRHKIIWENMTRDEAGALLFSWNPKTNQACTEGTPDCVSLTKDQWVMTTRDSLFQLVRRAKAVVENGYEVISPPKPPSSFHVTSGTDKISIEWTPTETPAGGWDLYRVQNRFQGFPAPGDEEKYRLIAHLDPGTTSYEDSEVDRNVAYFYFLQAIGGPMDIDPMAINGTPSGAPLKSSRYYAQSYDPAFLKKAPGATLADARIVPNPYNLGANKDLRWPDQQNKIAFLDIPGHATINIYTELGELVKTIVHADGSGDENWNLTTDSNQLIVSGIYIAVIRDDDSGEHIIKKFVVIR
ncbi:MAG TPA: T9SS type A sorting domain-containing protein [Rhodothermales bacterium]|nr:T9SS type A sorting domain-containing protein [Rhodothermales bacterium]